ncbi:MAG: hypothetical protein H7Z15_13330 [Rhizobacter sp.]|nr:hypothetical protein [Rhizobacter sp.]
MRLGRGPLLPRSLRRPVDARGAGAGKDGVMLMLPWECALSDYRPQDGMLIPMVGEAAWVRREGRKAYFVGNLQKLRYEFLP